MPKVTWLGTKDDPDVNLWKGHLFKKGEALEVNDPYILQKAVLQPQYYKVEGYEAPAAKGVAQPPTTYPAPSQSGHMAQRPAAKPGEPIYDEPNERPPEGGTGEGEGEGEGETGEGEGEGEGTPVTAGTRRPTSEPATPQGRLDSEGYGERAKSIPTPGPNPALKKPGQTGFTAPPPKRP